jgi:hypothetical protein
MKNIAHVRQGIESRNYPTSTLLEIAQPLLAQPGSTAMEWEMIELLLTRALCQIKTSPSTNLESAIKSMLSALLPTRSRYRRNRIDPQMREDLLIEIARFRYQLSYTINLEQLVTGLLPRKRRLHTQLPVALGDIDLLSQALHFSIQLRQQFSITFENLIGRIDSLTHSLKEQSSLTAEDLSKVENVRLLCRDILEKFDGPYEENGGKFGKLLMLHSRLKEIAGQHGLEHLLQPTLAERLEEKLKIQTEWLASQVGMQSPEEYLTAKVVKLKKNLLPLWSWETAALACLPNQVPSQRSIAAQEVLSRGTALVAAIKDCQFEFAPKESDTASHYLCEQLLAATRQLELLASRPCTKQSDIELAVNLRQTLKKWNLCLKSPQAGFDALSA